MGDQSGRAASGLLDAAPHRLIAALALIIGSFIVLPQWGGSPPGSTYIPARIEDGHFVPGETK